MKNIFLTTLLILAVATTNAQSKSPFLFESGNTSIKFGGHVRLNSYVDFDGVVANNDFRAAIIPVNGSWMQMERLNMDISHSRMSVKAIQKTTSLGDIEFYIETDFRGTGNSLRLRQAYVSFKGFVIGQAWGFMNDFASKAPSIDIQGANSRTFYRTQLIGYKAKLSDLFSMGISLEMPTVKMDNTSQFVKPEQLVPDIPVYIQFNPKGGHLRLAAVLRSMRYGNVQNTDFGYVSGFGAQLSGSVKAAEFLTLYSQATYGKGISKYINDLSLLNMDIVSARENSVSALPMYGISAGMMANLGKNWSASATVSTAGFENKEDYYSANSYFKGNYFSAGIFWNGVRNMTLASEYIRGKRYDMSGESGSANRFQVMLMYKW
ncbi:MAG: hypothetical protein EOM16_04755 [Bacteroidia bacterium]|jgi:hypothetical protein|nr:DcaP family trimeric outer membrane transporter [Bacteroidales bacterium]NCC46326.1 hypothetical protein [Bacteroidia bacterium]